MTAPYYRGGLLPDGRQLFSAGVGRSWGGSDPLPGAAGVARSVPGRPWPVIHGRRLRWSSRSAAEGSADSGLGPGRHDDRTATPRLAGGRTQRNVTVDVGTQDRSGSLH